MSMSSSSAWYRARLAKGQCRCGRKVARGHARCRTCLRQLRADAKARYARYVLENRCRRCTAPPAPGNTHCAAHAADTKKIGRAAVKRLIKKRREAGQCVNCKTKTTTYYCPKCRNKFSLRAKARRRAP